MQKYKIEREGQIDFYQKYIQVVDNSIELEDIISDNNDGVLNGNLLEFKLNIDDLNSVLFQAIKYQSARRIKGKPVVKNMLLISLNNQKAYLYYADKYIEDIEKVYVGGASIATSGFIGKSPDREFDLQDSMDEYTLINTLKEKNYVKINIDENCIVGWATRYYHENPLASKADFIGDLTGEYKVKGEIREPTFFKEYINAYEGITNERFKYLMDKLNDDIKKKNLGAFYTHPKYAEKSVELVREAIKRVPKGNDYIILDRCAGTGNLEQFLSDEELQHTIVSTVEYYEYKVLLELYGSKVRYIVPPIEKEDTFNMGLVRGADALSQEYVENPVIKSFIDNPNCTIILFENPPYAETTSIEHQKKGKGKASSVWKKSYVVEEMKKEIKGTATNDLGNAFIWSAFKYYLRQPTDSYIVYSPVKYWKAQHLINKKFLGGFAFNRRHFHTNIDACIMCALWSNEDEIIDTFTIHGYDIDKKETLVDYGNLIVSRIFSDYSRTYFDKRMFEDDKRDGITCELNGTERQGVSTISYKLYNNNLIGYMAVYSSGFDNPDLHSSLLRCARYDAHGFYLRADNFIEKLPMFAASRYITYNREWTERARIMKSADGADKFFKDINSGKLTEYLYKCLLFTCLETQNHMRTFTGSDGRFYRNEICLDNTNGNTLAINYINRLNLNKEEKELIDTWNMILKCAKETENYKPEYTYGVYQIIDELNTYYKDEDTGDNVYDYPELNGHLKTLKKLVKEYYNKEIVPTLFEYEFLK